MEGIAGALALSADVFAVDADCMAETGVVALDSSASMPPDVFLFRTLGGEGAGAMDDAVEHGTSSTILRKVASEGGVMRRN
mmetsp:Transcript_19140/g.57742  ORF Transcript_19140/g.57742 Transcript_19140/m.57742 type:complete len:81 (-) Transcript_19140:166-408(-)|eukprot:scaffold264494_cov27-Tisochrysis_lutea.AAC.4